MKKFENPAILVVDMLNDFVTGALACDRGKAIVPATAELLDAARAAGVPVIFCNDATSPASTASSSCGATTPSQEPKGRRSFPN